MTQISKNKLHPDMEKTIKLEWYSFLTGINSPHSMQHFLLDFLTPTETIMLSKRFMIMVLLMRGRTIEQIKDIVHVSNSAVMSVTSWLKYPSPTTQKLLALLSKKKDWEAISDRIEELLDKLPPPKYRNWSQVGKDKLSRRKTRLLKTNLR